MILIKFYYTFLQLTIHPPHSGRPKSVNVVYSTSKIIHSLRTVRKWLEFTGVKKQVLTVKHINTRFRSDRNITIRACTSSLEMPSLCFWHLKTQTNYFENEKHFNVNKLTGHDYGMMYGWCPEWTYLPFYPCHQIPSHPFLQKHEMNEEWYVSEKVWKHAKWAKKKKYTKVRLYHLRAPYCSSLHHGSAVQHQWVVHQVPVQDQYHSTHLHITREEDDVCLHSTNSHSYI